MKRKVIISLCPTGMVPTKELTPFVPTTPEEIISTTIACAKLGVSMVHIHPRDENGKPTWKKEIFAKIISGIREKNPDLIINTTTSGRDWSEFEKRSECLDLTGDVKPDMASLTIGSMNFIKSASVNDPLIIEQLAIKMGEKGIKPELEVFEPGMVYKANFLMEKGILDSKNPYFNILLGSLGTSPFSPMSLASFLALLPSNAHWALAGIGNYQLDANIAGLAFGGNIRIGLEDNIYFDRTKQKLATNKELVKRIVSIIKKMELDIATPKEAREIIGV